MIVLDSAQILTSVKLSLETHVLPELDDDFARVQVLAALKACGVTARAELRINAIPKDI